MAVRRGRMVVSGPLSKIGIFSSTDLARTEPAQPPRPNASFRPVSDLFKQIARAKMRVVVRRMLRK